MSAAIPLRSPPRPFAPPRRPLVDPEDIESTDFFEHQVQRAEVEVERDAGDANVFSNLDAALSAQGAERQWFAEGAIEGTPIVGLAAPEKKGKTWGALDLAIATLVGGRWLDRFAITRPGPPVIIESENGEFDVARRLSRIARGRGLNDRDARAVVNGIRHIWAPGLMMREGNEDLERALRACERLRPSLIVFDPWRNIVEDENSTAETIAAMRHVARFRELGAVILVLHHVNKDGRFSGARALRGRCDMFLEGVEQREFAAPIYRAIGRTLRPSDPIAQPFRIDLEHDEEQELVARTRVIFRGLADGDAGPVSAETKTEKPLTANERRVLAELDAAAEGGQSELSGRQLRDRIGGWSGKTTSDALEGLLARGLVTSRKVERGSVWASTGGRS